MTQPWLEPDQLVEQLRTLLELNDWRAAIVLVVAGPRLAHEAQRARELLGLEDELLVVWSAGTTASEREQLVTLNRGRDELLRSKRLIWLEARTPADVRTIRKLAPDLTAALDLHAELSAPRTEAAEWARCSEQLRTIMLERHRSLDFTGLLPARSEQAKLPLDELYQPLVERALEEQELPRQLTIDDEPPGPRGLLLYGHPGTGKTTYLRRLAVDYARGQDPLELGPEVQAPLLLSLSDYGWERQTGRVQSLRAYLPTWLAEQGVQDADALELSHIVLLLDGLDELPELHIRRALLDELGELRHELGGLVVTGRSFLVDELRKQDGPTFRLTTTRAPTQTEQRAFLTRFIHFRGGAADHAERLVARIEQDTDLSALARTPLMLAFMAILDELEGRLPDRRVELYYRLGEMLVDRWTRARSLATSDRPRRRPTRADALRVLGPLAWWTLERGGGALPEDELLAELERIEARREEPAEAKRRAQALLELLRADTALLVPATGQRWSFVHTSVAEYFAGVEAERDPARWQALLADPFKAEWREVLLFCAGQLGVIEGRVDSLDALVEAVLARSKRSGRYDAKYASLLMALLAESPGLSRRQLERLTSRLLELVLTMSYAKGAALQVQREFLGFTVTQQGEVKSTLGVELQRYFSPGDPEPAWDRLLITGVLYLYFPEYIRYMSDRSTAWVSSGVLGVLIRPMCYPAWTNYLSLDLDHTIATWASSDNWRLRFAAWFARLDPAQRERPFAELAEESGLKEILSV